MNDWIDDYYATLPTQLFLLPFSLLVASLPLSSLTIHLCSATCFLVSPVNSLSSIPLLIDPRFFGCFGAERWFGRGLRRRNFLFKSYLRKCLRLYLQVYLFIVFGVSQIEWAAAWGTVWMPEKGWARVVSECKGSCSVSQNLWISASSLYPCPRFRCSNFTILEKKSFDLI